MKIYPNLHIGTKIVITFTIISMVGFSALNLLNIQYYKKSLRERSLIQAEKIVKLKISNTNIELPDEIISTNTPINQGNFILIIKDRDVYYYLNDSSIIQSAIKLSIILFIIESILFICLMLLTYQFTNKFIAEIESNERFLNLLLLSFNHKICNFLMSQRINIDIIGAYKQGSLEPCILDMRAYQRLKSSYLKIEEEMKRTLQLLKTHPLKIKEEILIGDIINQTLLYFENDLTERTVFFSKTNLDSQKPIMADENDIKDILYNLMDNAVKYSINYINIRLSFVRKGVFIYIINDIAGESFAHEGNGLGLEIVNTILIRYKGRLSTRRKIVAYSYIAQVWIPYK